MGDGGKGAGLYKARECGEARDSLACRVHFPQSLPVSCFEARPIEARPIEARPIEARPIEARPIEARPTETCYAAEQYTVMNSLYM